MRLTHLEPTEDRQVGEPLTTVCDCAEVAGRIEPRRMHLTSDGEQSHRVVWPHLVKVGPPHGVVDVLGEGDRRKAELERSFARRAHRTLWGIPRPFGMDMAVSR